MLTQEDDVDVHALHRQGWTISAIARHLGHDRKTIRAYVKGDRVAGQRVSAVPDPFELFATYCTQRLKDDPHVWATTLFDEVLELGFDRSYPSFTRDLRSHRIRPHCEPCASSKGRDHTVIEHPPGEETQWDWLELPDPPAHWGCLAVRTCSSERCPVRGSGAATSPTLKTTRTSWRVCTSSPAASAA